MQAANRILILCKTVLITLVLTACGPDYHYTSSVDIPDERWSYDHTLDFEFEIADTLQIYNLVLEIAHHKDYAYQNLYTRIATFFPSGENLSETLSLELANKAGQWQGDCGSQYCKLRIPIQTGAYFNEAGVYRISLEQYMRKDPINGIKNISFFVEKTKNARKAGENIEAGEK